MALVDFKFSACVAGRFRVSNGWRLVVGWMSGLCDLFNIRDVEREKNGLFRHGWKRR